jgi:hypothetical protein
MEIDEINEDDFRRIKKDQEDKAKHEEQERMRLVKRDKDEKAKIAEMGQEIKGKMFTMDFKGNYIF